MPIRVPEIRELAEALRGAIARERYETKAGLKDRSDLVAVYRQHGLLLGPEVLPAVQRELAEAKGEARRRLAALLAWLSEQQVESAIAPLEDQLRGWEATATVAVAGQVHPFRRVPARIARTEHRATRDAWASAYADRLEDAGALRLDMLHREREAIEELGLGDYLTARERIARLNLRGFGSTVGKLLEATREQNRSGLDEILQRHAGVSAPDASMSDMAWLKQARWMGEWPEPGHLFERLGAATERLGLPLPPGRRVETDLARRRLKVPGAFSAALEVPIRTVIVSAPAGGWSDLDALLHEVGCALHIAYTQPGLPLEDRSLGDTSVTETFGLLFRGLAREPAWLEATFDGFPADELSRLARVLHLFAMRRDAGRFLWDLELAASARPATLREAYVTYMEDATAIGHDPRGFLQDHRRGFFVARRLRAQLLCATLRNELAKRFGAEWFVNPASGPYLAELMSSGLRDDAGEVARQLGAERLSSGPLLESVAEWDA